MEKFEFPLHGGVNAIEITLALDGEVVHRQQGHSFLRPYITGMHALMGGRSMQLAINCVHNKDVNNWDLENSQDFVDDIFSYDAGGGDIRTRLTIASHTFGNGDGIYVYNVNGNLAAAGFHNVVYVDVNTIELSGPVVPTGTYDPNVSTAYYRKADATVGDPQTTDGNGTRPTADIFGNPQIRVGSGTAANTVSTVAFENEIGNANSTTLPRVLLAGTATVSEPAIGASVSDIEIEQTFTNNHTTDSVEVNEIGIWTRMSDVSSTRRLHALMVRDVLGAPITVLAGQVLTVTYNLKTDVPTTQGGILIQYNEIFYRQLSQGTREAKDVYNQNSVKGPEAGQFWTQGSGGNSNVGPFDNGSRGQFLGPQVGSSTTNVVNTDFRLQDGIGTATRYEHGTGTDQLLFSGTYVSDITIGAADLSFEIARVFENASGAQIDIDEIGLFSGIMDNNNVETSYCLARHQVSPTLALLDGEFLKVTYTFKITV